MTLACCLPHPDLSASNEAKRGKLELTFRPLKDSTSHYALERNGTDSQVITLFLPAYESISLTASFVVFFLVTSPKTKSILRLFGHDRRLGLRREQ